MSGRGDKPRESEASTSTSKGRRSLDFVRENAQKLEQLNRRKAFLPTQYTLLNNEYNRQTEAFPQALVNPRFSEALTEQLTRLYANTCQELHRQSIKINAINEISDPQQLEKEIGMMEDRQKALNAALLDSRKTLEDYGAKLY